MSNQKIGHSVKTGISPSKPGRVAERIRTAEAEEEALFHKLASMPKMTLLQIQTMLDEANRRIDELPSSKGFFDWVDREFWAAFIGFLFGFAFGFGYFVAAVHESILK